MPPPADAIAVEPAAYDTSDTRALGVINEPYRLAERSLRVPAPNVAIGRHPVPGKC